ncbi:MAG: TetR/AcrR family transcriptional regulator [Actinomycetota bacterium]
MTTSEPRSEEQPKGAQTRSRILAETRRVLVDDGYDAVVMRTVAESVGVKLGNLQYYFPTRDDLLLAVITAEAATDIEDIRSVAGSTSAPLDGLIELVNLLVTKWRGDSGIVLATLGFLRMHKPDFDAAYRTVYAAFYSEVEPAIERAVPGLARGEYRRRARLLTALLDGAAMQLDVGPRSEYIDAVSKAALHIALSATAPIGGQRH